MCAGAQVCAPSLRSWWTCSTAITRSTNTRLAQRWLALLLVILAVRCRQPAGPAYANGNRDRKNSHKTREEDKAYIDPHELIREEDPSQSADDLRSCTSQGAEVPSHIRAKQHAQRTEQFKAKNHLGVRKAGVTQWKMHGGHWAHSLPESQQPVCVSCSSYQDQHACNPVEHRRFHRSFS